MTQTGGGQSGFSAVELLITLFIAVAFITTGYQLYSVIIKNSGEARVRTTASNIAYDNLRRYSPQVTNPCSAVIPTPAPTIPAGSGLASPTITVTISCPFGFSSPTGKIEATLTYGSGSPQEEVVHALYVTN